MRPRGRKDDARSATRVSSNVRCFGRSAADDQFRQCGQRERQYGSATEDLAWKEAVRWEGKIIQSQPASRVRLGALGEGVSADGRVHRLRCPALATGIASHP
jgi:hypothetical protein